MAIPAIIRRFPFTLIGLVTLGLFAVVARNEISSLYGLLRILIVPMYAGWLVAMSFRDALDGIWWLPVMYSVGFIPYLLADYLLSVGRSIVGRARDLDASSAR